LRRISRLIVEGARQRRRDPSDRLARRQQIGEHDPLVL
jgi:hypothetical protein